MIGSYDDTDVYKRSVLDHARLTVVVVVLDKGDVKCQISRQSSSVNDGIYDKERRYRGVISHARPAWYLLIEFSGERRETRKSARTVFDPTLPSALLALSDCLSLGTLGSRHRAQPTIVVTNYTVLYKLHMHKLYVVER